MSKYFKACHLLETEIKNNNYCCFWQVHQVGYVFRSNNMFLFVSSFRNIPKLMFFFTLSCAYGLTKGKKGRIHNISRKIWILFYTKSRIYRSPIVTEFLIHSPLFSMGFGGFLLFLGLALAVVLAVGQVVVLGSVESFSVCKLKSKC